MSCRGGARMPAMMTSHAAIVAFAVVGGALSLAAPMLAARGEAARRAARWVNRAAYVFMAASMMLFILAGLTR